MVRCVASTFEPFLITLNMSLKPLESTWRPLQPDCEWRGQNRILLLRSLGAAKTTVNDSFLGHLPTGTFQKATTSLLDNEFPKRPEA